MTEQSYRVLDFHKLLDLLSCYASSPLGQSNCLSLIPAFDLEIIDNEHKLVSEMKLLLHVKGFFSFEGLIDIGPFLNDSRIEGSHLEPDNLLSIGKTIEISRHFKKFLQENKTICPGLHDLGKGVVICDDLKDTIHRSISPHGNIRDSASPELRRIRKKKASLRRELQQKLENIKRSILSPQEEDYLISIRDGRYVIPLKTDLKNRVNGIVHDYSHSQATCYFEPIQVIQDNNDLAELIHMEKEEEIRVLSHLTTIVRDSIVDLFKEQEFLGKLDGLYARAKLSNTLKGVRPIMKKTGIVSLKKANNPILMLIAPEGESPVPVDIFLDREVNVMLISGPNRGGKTVALKTLGLLSLMAQAGIHIPADEGSCLPVFKKIMAEIGDEQDIQTGFSTFSAHATHLKHILEQADRESLVIIDEPGMGTDPDEGAALAMAVLDELSSKDAFIAVSTHFNRLKAYGLLNERAKNACMEFDPKNNRSTFILRYGTPGTSYATEVARDIGIKEEILERAKNYLHQDEVRLNRLIDKLNGLTQETALEKLDSERVKQKYHKAKGKLLKTLEKLESENKAGLEKKKAEADRLIAEAKTEFSAIINSLKKNNDSYLVVARRRYNEIINNVRDVLTPEEEKEGLVDPERFELGQWVRHKRYHQEGTILSLDRDRANVTVMAGELKYSAEMKDLEIISNRINANKLRDHGPLTYPLSEGPGKEVNVIGYRVDDALPLIDKLIDSAVVEGKLAIKIIHGYGTGKLRESIRQHLKGLPFVKRITGADPRSGGEAITIVELK